MPAALGEKCLRNVPISVNWIEHPYREDGRGQLRGSGLRLFRAHRYCAAGVVAVGWMVKGSVSSLGLETGFIQTLQNGRTGAAKTQRGASGPAALGTDHGRQGLYLRPGHGQIKAMSQLNQRADLFQCYRTAGVHEAIVTNLHKPRGQHMLEKATDELHHRESKSPPAVAAGFPVAEGDGSILHRNDAVVGYGHPKDIRGKVLEACFAGTNGLAVDDPIGLPDLIGDVIQQAGFFHFVSKFASYLWMTRKLTPASSRCVA